MTEPTEPETADALAVRVGAAIRANDSASRALGIEIVEMREGYAQVRMQVRDDMLNGLGSCHGGMLFSLADSAFAYACNSRNQATVAAGCSIEFLAPVPPGTHLSAVAQERVLVGRRGVYDVTVSKDDGEVVATFRGISSRVKGEVIGATPLF